MPIPSERSRYQSPRERTNTSQNESIPVSGSSIPAATAPSFCRYCQMFDVVLLQHRTAAAYRVVDYCLSLSRTRNLLTWQQTPRSWHPPLHKRAICFPCSIPTHVYCPKRLSVFQVSLKTDTAQQRRLDPKEHLPISTTRRAQND